MKFNQRLIVGSRPSHVPADAIIFNAPRPLFGSVDCLGCPTWQGEFCTGIFYAAVTAGDTLRANWMEQNRRQAATVLVYITEAEAKAMVNYLYERYPSMTDEIFNDVWKNMFNEYHRNSTVEIEA